MDEIKSLTNGQIIALLKGQFIIGFNPDKLRAELKKRNREAFKNDLKRRNKIGQSPKSRHNGKVIDEYEEEPEEDEENNE